MKKLMPLNVIGASLLALAAGGCAANMDRYPSLAIRDFERVHGEFDVADHDAPFVPPAPASASAIERAQESLQLARAQHQEFIEFAPQVQQKLLAARGLTAESNIWADGQIALAQLDIRRSRNANILGDLDLMFAQASLSYQELQEIDEARRIVSGLIAEEDKILTALFSTAN